MNDMTRRNAVGTLAALGLSAGGLRAATGSHASALSGANLLSPVQLGWDAQTGQYTLPPLPYEADALVPHIDAQTMQIHHDKHHAGYVKGLNTALARLAEIRSSDADAAVMEHWLRELSFNAGGHINHTLFWGGMAPASQNAVAKPAGALLAAINRDFGSFEQFDRYFQNASVQVEASGWGWLIHEPMSDRLMVIQMHSQQHSAFVGATPLLGVDVWEHAYYLKYQNRRADYVAAFMKVVDWAEVERRYAVATRA